jgi:hypothetical protein
LEGDILKIPMDIVLLVEKSSHVDVTAVKRVVEGISKALEESEVIRVGLIVFSSNPLPLADLSLQKERIAEIFDEVPVLPGPPNLVRALTEALEMFNDFSDPLVLARFLVIICGCNFRHSKGLRIALRSLDLMNVHPLFLIIGSKIPSWLTSLLNKDQLMLVRWNTGPERVALKLIDAMSRIASKLSAPLH